MTIRSAEVCERSTDRVEQIRDRRDSVPLRPQAVILRWQRLPGRPWWGQGAPLRWWRKGISSQPWGPLSSQRVRPPPGKGLLLSLCRDEQVLPKKHLATCQPRQVALPLESKQVLVESSATRPRPMPPWLSLLALPLLLTEAPYLRLVTSRLPPPCLVPLTGIGRAPSSPRALHRHRWQLEGRGREGEQRDWALCTPVTLWRPSHSTHNHALL